MEHEAGKPPQLFDFHLHSYWSWDASAPVEYYLRGASRLGMKAIAVTDHFNADSINDIIENRKRYPDVRCVAGVELAVETSLGEAHVVCLGLPDEIPGGVKAVLKDFSVFQREYARAVSRAMKKRGVEYTLADMERLQASYRPAVVRGIQGITPVSHSVQKRYFTSAGIVDSAEEYNENFYGWIVDEIPRLPSAAEALPAFKRSGCILFLAHPVSIFRDFDVSRVDLLVDELMLDGIECGHDSVQPELGEIYEEYCRKNKLLCSGGSDSHADPESDPCGIATHHFFGRHYGKERWMEEILERLGSKGEN